MSNPLTKENIIKAIKDMPTNTKSLVCPYCGVKNFGIMHFIECEKEHYSKISERELARQN